MTDLTQTGAIATSNISQSDIQSLERLYTIRRPAEVLQFLDKYPFLVPLVVEAHGHIRHHFPDSPLFLEYVPDPEIDYPQLIVYIVTDLNPDKAIDTLDKFDGWWVKVSDKGQDKLSINLDWL